MEAWETPRKRALLIWTLRLAGLASGFAAQLATKTQPRLGLAGLLAGATLFFIAGRLSPLEPAPPPAPAAPLPTPRFWRTLLAAFAVCVVSGISVAVGLHPNLTHLLWALGLTLFAVTAFDERQEKARPHSWPRWAATAAMLTLLAIACGLLFVWNLTTVPPEIHGDEAEVGIDAMRLIQQSPFDFFRLGWFSLPMFHAAPTALGLTLFGPDLFGLRATSAVIGTATVLSLFFVCRRLWGVEVALSASILLASQRFFIHLSRSGHSYIDTPLLSVLGLLLFLRIWQERRLAAAIVCGIVLGLGIQTYYATRLVPPLIVLSLGIFLLSDRVSPRRGRLRELAVIVIVALATAAPLFGYFATHWADLWYRTRETSIFTAEARQHLSAGYGTDDLLSILAIQLRAVLGIFNLTGDNSVQYGYKQPLLEPISAALFVLGIGTIVARPRRRLLLVASWIGLPLVLGGALTIDAPFFPRITGILPFVAVWLALVIQTMVRPLREILPGRAGAVAAGVALSALLIPIVANNANSYFFDYSPRHRHSIFPEISQWIRGQDTEAKIYLLSGPPEATLYHGVVTFLAGDYDREDIEEPTTLFARSDVDPINSRFIIMPKGREFLTRLDQTFGPLRIEEHHSLNGDLSFYTAVPIAARASPGGAPHLADSSALPDTGTVSMIYVLALGAVLIALVLLPRWVGSASPVGGPEPDGAPASMATRLFGPTAREREVPLPRWVSVAALAVIIALAGWLRINQLEELPAGFYCDEAGLGYNAYSILETGRDETGELLPLYIWSFDTSFKNPVFVYASMLPLSILGPTPFAVRLTAALFGLATVIGMFFLGRAMMGVRVGLLAALFLAICPWHLHFSRIAFELISFPTFFVFGLVGLVRFARGGRGLLWGTLLMALCFYTYVPAKLFVPLFLLGFAVFFRRPLLARRRETIAAACLFLLTVAPSITFDVQNQHRARQYFGDTTLLGSTASPVELGRRLIINYVAFFSTDFLFEKGDDIIRHAVQGHGELYPFFAPFLVLGLLTASGRRDPPLLLVLWWLTLYPLAAALLNEIPSASRGFIGAPGLCLLTAIGAGAALRWMVEFTSSRGRALALQAAGLALAAVFLVPQVRHYWRLYSEDYRLYAAKYYTGFQYGHREVIDHFRANYDEYDELIITTHMSNQPEAFLRFFAGLHEPPRDIPPLFEMPAKMNRGAPEELHLYKPIRQLFALIPDDLKYLAAYRSLGEVTAPDGTPAFLYVDQVEPKSFVYTWELLGPFAPDRIPPVPDFDPAQPPRQGPQGNLWIHHDAPTADVRLGSRFGADIDDACAWAVNFAHSDEDREVRVLAGFDDSGEIWINGARVPLQDRVPPHVGWMDTLEGVLPLQAGRNSVAVKTCDGEGTWRFYFRLAGDDERAPPGIEWEY
jgi:4-amino-4-deoxy-L-arabinose transferase-like glycosyltransferase